LFSSHGWTLTGYLRIENAEGYVLIAVYLFITFALKMPEGYVLIAVYLFIYLFICMCVIRKTQKVLNRIA